MPQASAQEQEQDRAMALFLLGNCTAAQAKLANQVRDLSAKVAEQEKLLAATKPPPDKGK